MRIIKLNTCITYHKALKIDVLSFGWQICVNISRPYIKLHAYGIW